MSGGLDDVERRAMVAAVSLGLDTARPARDLLVTRLRRRLYLGVRDGGYVRLTMDEGRQLASDLLGLIDAAEAENQPPQGS